MEDEFLKFRNLLSNSRRRKRKTFEYVDTMKTIEEEEDVSQQEMILHMTGLSAIWEDKPPRKSREKDKDRELKKGQWDDLYTNQSEDVFKEKTRVSRATFNLILNKLEDQLRIEPTNFKPNPTSPDRQLALTLYRLGHGLSYSILEDIFGLSKEASCKFFNKVVRLIVTNFYDDYVKLPTTDEEWLSELRGFVENYGFPCIGAWDGFHIYINSKEKCNYSFKKRYTINNLALTSYNKRFLYAAVGAPGSTHDSRMLRESSFFDNVMNGEAIPDRTFTLGDYGDIPLITVGDSAFPRFSWLIKCYDDNSKNEQHRYFNKMLRSARVVSENTYGMLKGRWRFLLKETECRPNNIRYIIMACIALHNVCIDEDDPCEPRWQLEVDDLALIRTRITRTENRDMSDLNRLKISNWLWLNH